MWVSTTHGISSPVILPLFFHPRVRMSRSLWPVLLQPHPLPAVRQRIRRSLLPVPSQHWGTTMRVLQCGLLSTSWLSYQSLSNLPTYVLIILDESSTYLNSPNTMLICLHNQLAIVTPVARRPTRTAISIRIPLRARWRADVCAKRMWEEISVIAVVSDTGISERTIPTVAKVRHLIITNSFYPNSWIEQLNDLKWTPSRMQMSHAGNAGECRMRSNHWCLYLQAVRWRRILRSVHG